MMHDQPIDILLGMGVNSFLVNSMDFDEFGEAVQKLCRYWLQFNKPDKP